MSSNDSVSPTHAATSGSRGRGRSERILSEAEILGGEAGSAGIGEG